MVFFLGYLGYWVKGLGLRFAKIRVRICGSVEQGAYGILGLCWGPLIWANYHIPNSLIKEYTLDGTGSA